MTCPSPWTTGTATAHERSVGRPPSSLRWAEPPTQSVTTVGLRASEHGDGEGAKDWLRVLSYFSLGQSSVSERGYQIMHAAGIQPAGACSAVRLGSPDLLVSARRRRIIELRDRHRAAISGVGRA